jgi:pilus assembly protein CpaE
MSDPIGIRIVMLDPDRSAAGPVRQALMAEPGFVLSADAGDEHSLLEAVRAHAADVVVVDIAGVTDVATLVRELVARRPDACVIATGRGIPAGQVGRVLASGAATFLPKPYRPDELVATVRELRDTQRPQVPPLAQARRGALIAVYSPKGGVGTTTVATSLAVALAARGSARVAIVDLDLQFGDVGVALDLKDASGIVDLLAHKGAIDDTIVTDVFARHASGVRALLAPEDPTDMGSIDVPEVIRLLDRLRPAFDYVVCDLWSSVEELVLAVLRAADRVVLVTTPEVPSLRHLRRVMNATAPLLSSDRTVIVANRAPSKVGLSVPEMERAIGMPVAAAIPSDGVGVTKAINQGMSIMDSRGSVGVVRAFNALAELLAKDLAHNAPGAVLAPSSSS